MHLISRAGTATKQKTITPMLLRSSEFVSQLLGSGFLLERKLPILSSKTIPAYFKAKVGDYRQPKVVVFC